MSTKIEVEMVVGRVIIPIIMVEKGVHPFGVSFAATVAGRTQAGPVTLAGPF